MALPILSAAARRLEGKVAIVTGGASGIGEYTAKLFTSHGAKVVIADIQDELGQSLCKELGPSATFVHCDVSNEAHVKNVVDHTMAQYGKLDIMHNNAAIVGPLIPGIIDTTLSEFEKVIKVNLFGPFLGTKHAARVMIPAKQGSIITTASTASVIGGASMYAYTSSKHGVVGLMKNAAVELGNYGVRVNCVSPHITSTPLARSFLNMKDEEFSQFYSNIKGERCKVEDVANAALFLASDDSKYVSGHNLFVDGGFTIMNTGFCMYEYAK
ncbi:secoisolariciresinol dehydrogenase-like [Silene latifolia]|uniref:secoisolariciresinol dehydrogenase-like n=1 Tax=Silene latifolia TaxID=37657 RepID=UPI003D77E18A